MMKLIGYGRFDGAELEGLVVPPAWRKATRNMLMSAISIERTLQRAKGWIEKANDHTGLVLNSSSGELDTSSEFLTTLARSGLARPVLFQNSLHNATTGFVSIHFKLTGPTFSISSGASGPRESLNLAESLINEGICRACLVTLVEGHRLLSGLIEQTVDEGAVSILLAQSSFAKEMGFGDRPDFGAELWNEDFREETQTAPLLSIRQCGFYRRIWDLENE